MPYAQKRGGTVRSGTAIYASAETGVWGLFTAATKVTVRVTAGSPWAELRRVPGLDGTPAGSPWLNGRVPMDAVTLDP